MAQSSIYISTWSRCLCPMDESTKRERDCAENSVQEKLIREPELVWIWDTRNEKQPAHLFPLYLTLHTIDDFFFFFFFTPNNTSTQPLPYPTNPIRHPSPRGPALRASSLLPTPISTNPTRKLCPFSKLLNKASLLPVSRTRSKDRKVRFSSRHKFFSARARGLLQFPVSKCCITFDSILIRCPPGRILHASVRLYVVRINGWWR